jgi:hypothetical protein
VDSRVVRGPRVLPHGVNPGLERLDSTPNEGGDDLDPLHLLSYSLLKGHDLSHEVVSFGRLGSR